MKLNYSTDEAVRVYDTPFNRSRAEAGETIPARPATVTGMMTPNNPQGWEDHNGNPLRDPIPTYWVAFADGAEPSVATVTADYLLDDETHAAGLSAASASVATQAAAALDEAKRLADEAQRLAQAATDAAAQ